MKAIRIKSCVECPFLTYMGRPMSPTCIKMMRYLTEEESNSIAEDCPLEDEEVKDRRHECGSFNESDF